MTKDLGITNHVTQEVNHHFILYYSRKVTTDMPANLFSGSHPPYLVALSSVLLSVVHAQTNTVANAFFSSVISGSSLVLS